MSKILKSLITIAAENPLSKSQAKKAFEILFQGSATQAQIGGFLMALRARGETINEFAAAAAVMREKCEKVSAPNDAMDIVGTGGDGKGTLNISTATAFVVAGAGVTVAKHGNRNLSSQSGAADALSELGVQVMLEAEKVQVVLEKVGICFMMAPMHHPAMAHVGAARAELGSRTIFNILGPLTNPAGVLRQLTGSYSRHLIRPMAETLRELGSEKAWLVHGADGTDELSICGKSWISILEPDGTILDDEIHPEDFGLNVFPIEEIKGGSPRKNAEAILSLLRNEKSAYREAVLLNSAAALIIANKTSSKVEAIEMAKESIASRAAINKLETLAQTTLGLKK